MYRGSQRGRWMLPMLALAVLTLAGCQDRVEFTNPNGSGEIGILLDAEVDGNVVNDATFTTAANGDVEPGDVTAAAHNEVVAYQQRRPVTLEENASWSAGADTVTVDFPAEMGIPFKVWLLQEPFADRHAQAIAACVRLAQIWKDERMGARISSFSITDKTGDPARTPFLDFTCSEETDLRSDIGFDSGRVNIYYVDRVNFGSGFSTGNGVWCGDNTVVMGSNASDHLSAHEAGHAFALGHVNGLTTDFDTTNVMHNASNNRQYLTEGQTFRAHLEPGSVINTTYNLRPGLPTRNCANLSLTATDECPKVQQRIWADGAGFPPN